MKRLAPAIFFDRDDYKLLAIVNDIFAGPDSSQSVRSLLEEHMHPHGIKEMAAPRGLRIAYAVASLLGSFEKGTAENRIKALRSLHDEVLSSSATINRKNTARVLMQIMKELLRRREDGLRQLRLAHDFRLVSTGNPRLVREQLEKYHLLEMPEEWNQFAFDDHVHDANTKGRKSPTHLLMDAWIKGIRYLTVIYYNYVSPAVVRELIEAATILDIHVQVGIEMSALFREKYVRIIWEPHGFSGNMAFLKFLEEDAVVELMKAGRAVSSYQQQYVYNVLDLFNSRHRKIIDSALGIELEPLTRDQFLLFVGVGQPSLLHLAKYLLTKIEEQSNARQPVLRQQLAKGSPEEREAAQQQLERFREMDVDFIIDEYLAPWRNPELADPSIPSHSEDVPDLLCLDLKNLIHRLLSLHSSSRFRLILSNLSVQDTLELIYSCEGMITHLEAYNLKDASHGMEMSKKHAIQGKAVAVKSPERYYELISDLQDALNHDNVIDLKRAIRAIIWDYEEQRLRLEKHIEFYPSEKQGKQQLLEEHHQMQARKQELLNILFHLETFHNFYKKKTLGSRIGSSSTGQAEHRYGMGLVLTDTLPPRAKKNIKDDIISRKRQMIPVTGLVTRHQHYRCHEQLGDETWMRGRRGWKRFLFGRRGCVSWGDWTLDGLVVHPGKMGNIATLGGVTHTGGTSPAEERKWEERRRPWHYLNTNLKNSLKVLIGFLPAFLTFFLTKDWWLLAYFGAVIWFCITGLRNILQSVLGGGGLRRSPLLPWNSLISWSRIADSLLYTGFSVPLLDFLVKTLLLANYMGVTTANNPVLLYAVMGLANGIYISSHNTFRGLPRSAAFGNFFRSILAIPIAILFNTLISIILSSLGVVDVAGVLQKWAAIISKLASDCVAAIIEGLADRQVNIRARLQDYQAKIAQLFAVFSRLDLLFPEEDVLDILQSPEIMMEALSYEAVEQDRLIIVNALDLMYFWLYQPRSRRALKQIVATMSREEWLIFFRSQLVLNRYKEISQFFIDGLVGKNFSKALSFYLERYEGYLRDLEKLEAGCGAE